MDVKVTVTFTLLEFMEPQDVPPGQTPEDLARGVIEEEGLLSVVADAMQGKDLIVEVINKQVN